MGAVSLLLVRHGESVGNIARERAYAAGAAEIAGRGGRDADVPLTARGVEQSAALGRRLGALPRDRRPQAVWSSPYRRALDTARAAVAAGGLDLPVRLDERLRDRELGILDGLTGIGIRERFPEEAERKRVMGKLYHRPPGGESWADMALRLRSVLRDLDEAEDGRRVLVVTHDAVVLLVRYIEEQLTEAELLGMAERTRIRNTSLTELSRPPATGPWTVTTFDDVSHLGTGTLAP